jgi:hypothetical protein
MIQMGGETSILWLEFVAVLEPVGGEGPLDRVTEKDQELELVSVGIKPSDFIWHRGGVDVVRGVVDYRIA